jgi:HSP20 family protein
VEIGDCWVSTTNREETMAIMQYQPTTDVFGPLFENFFAPFTGTNRLSGMLRTPPADVVETESEIRVMVELPGLRPEDVSVDLENNVLTIRGEKTEERTEGDERNTWHLAERRYGSFTRSFVLPRDVEQDQIQANFENGVLTVSIPKSEKARRRRIEIRSGNGQARRVAAGAKS